MANLGKYNNLTILRKTDFGFILDGKESGDILLPNRYVTKEMEVGQTIKVFVYLDGEERWTATTLHPHAAAEEVARLKVNAIEKSGAFLDWGIMKDILLPFSEQKIKVEVGKSYLVYIYVDPVTERITATMKLEKFLDKTPANYKEGEKLEGIVWTKTELGYKIILENKHTGLLYSNETFKKMFPGDKIDVWVKRIRTDGKVDLVAEPKGFKISTQAGELILQKLKEAGGSMPVHDKTPPEVIYQQFGISKKAFKAACGQLYKARKIEITPSGIKII